MILMNKEPFLEVFQDATQYFTSISVIINFVLWSSEADRLVWGSSDVFFGNGYLFLVSKMLFPGTIIKSRTSLENSITIFLQLVEHRTTV